MKTFAAFQLKRPTQFTELPFPRFVMPSFTLVLSDGPTDSLDGLAFDAFQVSFSLSPFSTELLTFL